VGRLLVRVTNCIFLSFELAVQFAIIGLGVRGGEIGQLFIDSGFLLEGNNCLDAETVFSI
jgi:hypothetical protein